MNVLPIFQLPHYCHVLDLRTTREWGDLRAITAEAEGALLFSKSDKILCWGAESLIRKRFPDLISIKDHDLSSEFGQIGRNLHIKGFVEDALCRALARDKPLLSRTTRAASFLIADPHHRDQSILDALHHVVGKIAGPAAGLVAPIDTEHPHTQQVHWAEALRISVEFIEGNVWLLLDPDVWIWPPRARKEAAAFLDKRRGDRYNKTYNALIEAWLDVLLGAPRPEDSVPFSVFDDGSPSENPAFVVGTALAYSRERK